MVELKEKQKKEKLCISNRMMNRTIHKTIHRARLSRLSTYHLRKAGAEDALDELNATTGLSATADNILILKRERGQADASLFGTGREIELDKALSFNDGHWKLLGEGTEYRLSQEQREVINALNQAKKPLGAKEIADSLQGMGKQVTDGAIRTRILIMKNNGLVKDMGNGKYESVTNTTNTTNMTNTLHNEEASVSQR